MAAPETLLRQRVAALIEDEFALDSGTVKNDKLPRAAGKDGADEIATSPENAYPHQGNWTQLVVRARVQFYMGYDATPDEYISVDPAIIEAKGDQFRRALEGNQSGNSPDFWYLNLISLDYPDDPTGNKTRFEAVVEGRCNNPAFL